MDKQGKWRLSPAYDMCYAYNPNGAWTSAHQMSINGKFDDITRHDLLELGARNNIRNASHIIDEVCDACATWPRIAKECDVPQSMIDEILPNMQLHSSLHNPWSLPQPTPGKTFSYHFKNLMSIEYFTVFLWLKRTHPKTHLMLYNALLQPYDISGTRQSPLHSFSPDSSWCYRQPVIIGFFFSILHLSPLTSYHIMVKQGFIKHSWKGTADDKLCPPLQGLMIHSLRKNTLFPWTLQTFLHFSFSQCQCITKE